jgi:hypothetical protein
MVIIIAGKINGFCCWFNSGAGDFLEELNLLAPGMYHSELASSKIRKKPRIIYCFFRLNGWPTILDNFFTLNLKT